MGHVLGYDNVKDVRLMTGKGEVSRVFWADDLKYRVVGDELIQRFSVGVGYFAVPRGMLGI